MEREPALSSSTAWGVRHESSGYESSTLPTIVGHPFVWTLFSLIVDPLPTVSPLNYSGHSGFQNTFSFLKKLSFFSSLFN